MDAIREKAFPYIKYVPTLALVAGLVFDIFTLQRPDELFENVTIVGYLALSAVVMLLLQARQSDNPDDKRRLLLLSILQFSFGNLASALMVLYSRSGTLAGSAIFIGILALLFLGNELLKNRYARTHLRVMIWFTLLVTYSTLIVPVILNTISIFVFFLSVGAALAITLFLVVLLSQVSREAFKARARRISFSIFAVTVLFSTLYLNNLIPPVPLSLKSIGIYHSVVRTDDSYAVSYESPHWYEFWRDTSTTLTLPPSTPVYCFSSVFAPRTLETEIRHRWEKYNQDTETWETVARIPFPIRGGRDNGYRGYTQTFQVDIGVWRCSVETNRGALLGRTEFNVVRGTPQLVDGTL